MVTTPLVAATAARFVIDASVAAKWILLDESSAQADDVLAMVSTNGAIVPAIFPFEIEHVVLVAERRHRLASAEASEALAMVARLDIVVDPFELKSLGRHLDSARRFEMTAYDASYATLAARLSLALYTADEGLAAAARRQNVTAVLIA